MKVMTYPFGLRYLRLVLLLVCFILISDLCTSQYKQEEKCGINPQDIRIFSKWNMPKTPHTILVSAYREGTQSWILIAQVRSGNERNYKKTAYFSSDHGSSWLEDTSETGLYGNVVSLPNKTLTGIMDHANKNIRWRIKNFTKIELSLDRGQSWQEISPVLDRGGKIGRIELIGAGKTGEGTLFAGIGLILGGGEDFSVYRSNDYGRSFSLISDEVLYLVESPANSNIMIGVNRGGPELHHAIVVSENGGKTWKRTADDIVSDRVDQYPYNARPVKQIEPDPADSQTFYVLTWTGIYVTRDLGKRFKLLPLATEFVYGVDNIAVDPIDSQFVYAVVKGADFYRSANKGCTWEKLKIPLLPR